MSSVMSTTECHWHPAQAAHPTEDVCTWRLHPTSSGMTLKGKKRRQQGTRGVGTWMSAIKGGA